MKPFIYMGYGVNKPIFGITGTEEPKVTIIDIVNYKRIEILYGLLAKAKI